MQLVHVFLLKFKRFHFFRLFFSVSEVSGEPTCQTLKGSLRSLKLKAELVFSHFGIDEVEVGKRSRVVLLFCLFPL